MKRCDIEQASNEELSRMVREHQEREREELRRVIESGSDEEKRALSARNHRGVAPVRWHPDRVRRKD